MRPLRVVSIACGVVVGLFFVMAALFYLVAQVAFDPTATAKAKGAAEGWTEQDLGVVRYESSNDIFGGVADVELVVKGQDPPKTIRVDLRRPMWLPYWEVVSYEESPPQQE